MALRISRTQRQQLLDWATAAKPNECCGLLMGRAAVVETLELTENVADNPSQEFEIDPAALIAAERRARNGGTPIAGYFHSHPNGAARPSRKDAEMAAADGRLWLIIASDEITLWKPVSTNMDGVVGFVQTAWVEG